MAPNHVGNHTLELQVEVEEEKNIKRKSSRPVMDLFQGQLKGQVEG